jgi:endonuclease III
MKSSRSSAAERATRVVEGLAREYPDAHCALIHETPLQLLVATILSAQCTDARVNQVTATLFKKYPDARAFAAAKLEELERDIRPTGFFRNKAKSIQGAAKLLLEKHGGRVPETMEELLELPGVARKTANVVLGTWFKKATGVVVDTHVARLSNRLKLTEDVDPKKIEQDLMRLLPSEEWIDFSHRMIWHGRKICVARTPKCGECVLASCCPSAGRIS